LFIADNLSKRHAVVVVVITFNYLIAELIVVFSDSLIFKTYNWKYIDLICQIWVLCTG